MPGLPGSATFVVFNQTTDTMKINRIIQIGFGGLLDVIGLNHLFHFFATPAYRGRAADLYAAFDASGYVFPAVGICMILTATALLTNRAITAGLLVLVPVLVNMVLFHLFLAPSGIVPPLALTAVTGYLFVARQPRLSSLLHT